MVPALRHTNREHSTARSMNWTNWRTMPKDASTSNISSRWDGASLRESPIAPTMISNNTPSTAARPSSISTKRANKRSFPMSSSPRPGADRSTLAFLVDAYHEEEVRGEKRVVLKFHPELAPIKIAVLPLLKKNDRIVETAKKLTADLRQALVRRLRRHGIHRSSLSAPRRSGHAFLRYRRRPDGGRRKSAGG